MATQKKKKATGSGKPAKVAHATRKTTPSVVISDPTFKPTHRGGLGRGLDALLGRSAAQGVGASTATPDGSALPRHEAPGRTVISVSIASIQPSPWQPRRVFDEEALQELSDSIRAHGIIQPLLCRALPAGGYELIGGERRLRAATHVGLKEVPIIVLEAVDRDAAEIALVENLQREDLNVIEEAEGYKALSDGFGLTQADIAERVGKARASVSNTMRLLELPDEAKQLLGAGLLSAGHAKVILGVEGDEYRTRLARDSVSEGLTVRMLEQRIARRSTTPKQRLVTPDIPEDYLAMLLEKLHHRFGTSVRVSPSVKFPNGRRGKGRLEIDFTDNDDLSRILDLLGVDVNEF